MPGFLSGTRGGLRAAPPLARCRRRALYVAFLHSSQRFSSCWPFLTTGQATRPAFCAPFPPFPFPPASLPPPPISPPPPASSSPASARQDRPWAICAPTGLDALLRSLTASGKPLLGVCLGCQILLERSEENDTETLGILPGFCRRFDPALTDGGEPLRIPHMGWNALHVGQADCPLFDGIEDGTPFYFVHSYYPEPDPALTLASCRYGSEFAAVFGRPGLWAAQFHPEKSGPAGSAPAAQFLRLLPCRLRGPPCPVHSVNGSFPAWTCATAA